METLTKKTNFSRKYMNEVKVLFPIIRKTEKTYLRQMKQNIDDYCEQATVSSMEDLYEKFGKPQDIVCHYYSIMDMAQFFSHIHLRRTIKSFLAFICVVIFAITLFYTVVLYQEHLTFMRQEVTFTETTISE